jgi:hypothetical protein
VEIQISLQVSSGIILPKIPYVDFIDLTIIDKQLEYKKDDTDHTHV